MDLLSKLKAGTSHTKEIVWPGTEEKVLIRLSSDNDHMQSVLATDQVFSDSKINIENLDAYNSERETQLLFRVILDPETKKQLFKNITAFRDTITLDIKDTLATELDAFETECNPEIDYISEEDFDKLVTSVKKNVPNTVGNISSIGIAKKLITYLVNQLPK
jgi:hypothetical protein